jgi:hypothetical protein
MTSQHFGSNAAGEVWEETAWDDWGTTENSNNNNVLKQQQQQQVPPAQVSLL